MWKITQLDTRDLGGKWRLLSPFVVTSADSNICVAVPAGFITDYASVPACLRWLMSQTGKHGKAAVVHDYLYHLAQMGKFDRRLADAIFISLMRELRVPLWRRWGAYIAVRVFGGVHMRLNRDA